MDRLYHNVLLEHREAIIKSADSHDLLLNHLITHLKRKECLNGPQEKCIRSYKAPRDRICCMLDFLSAEGEKAFEELCNSLEDFKTKDKRQLANLLRASLRKARGDTAPGGRLITCHVAFCKAPQ
jgi:hypothetical protein